ncbi:MAG: hypothetical protein ACRDNK_23270 [Solirubrobacteraceae bacterium]
MNTQTPVQSPSQARTPARVKRTIAGVFAQYIQDLTRPIEPAPPCATCP